MDVFVREMTGCDLAQVRQIYTLGWQNAFRGIVPQAYLDHLNLDNWTPPLDGAYVLTDGKRILGASSVSPARDPAFKDWGEIVSIYLLPGLIGQGYGHLLFVSIKEKLTAQYDTKIYLNVLEENIHARKFYERHGFMWNQERIPCNIGGRDLMELRYVFRKG